MSAGKRRWAHRSPTKTSKRSKLAKYAEKQKKHCEEANKAVARRRAETEQLVTS